MKKHLTECEILRDPEQPGVPPTQYVNYWTIKKVKKANSKELERMKDFYEGLRRRILEAERSGKYIVTQSKKDFSSSNNTFQEPLDL